MKLSAWVIRVFGLCVLIIAVTYGLVVAIPNWQETKARNDMTATLDDIANQMPQAKTRVKNAEADANTLAAQWNAIASQHTPPASVQEGGVDISVNAWQLVVDTEKFRNHVQEAINHQVKRGGVKVLNGPTLPATPSSAATILADYYNYPAVNTPVVIYDLGQVSVQGTYDQIMANVRSYSSMPNYLAVVDGLTLEGTSPVLRGTYNLTVIGFIRGQKLFTAVPEIASSTTTGGATGGFGAPGGRGPAGVPMGPMGPGGPPSIGGGGPARGGRGLVGPNAGGR